MRDQVKFSLRLYRALARAFPHEFQVLYGEDLERAGVDAAPEIWRRHGIWGLVRLLADIALRLAAEYLSELRADTKYALRMLAKSPGYAAVGIFSLTIGIGVCSFFFGEFNGLIMHPPAGVTNRAGLIGLDTPVPYTYFERYREQQGVASAAAFTDAVPFAVVRESEKDTRSERLFGLVVSPEYFSVLGMLPEQGRFFQAGGAQPETAPVVVISDRFWRTHLNSDPQAIGQALRVDGHLTTVLGVAPQDFHGVWPIQAADLFVPVTSGASIAPELAANAKPQACHVVIRLAPGSNPRTVEATLDAVTQRLDLEKPGAGNVHSARHVRFLSVNGIAPLPAAARAMVFAYISVLLGLVLSLACANLANLLLARSAQRRKEIAIRLSVGAGRFRLIRQLLTESIIISLAGGAGGFVLAYLLANQVFTSRLVSSLFLQANLASLRPDLGVLLLTLAVALITGVGFGLAPALATTRTDVATTLKQGALTPLRGYRRFGLRNLLVVYQVAGSLTLLLVTGYIIFGFGRSYRMDPGFDTRGVDLFQLDPSRDGYSKEQTAALYEKLPRDLSKLASVHAVTLADAVPFADIVSTAPNVHFSVPGAYGDLLRDAVRQRIGLGYFSTLGVPLVRGREFSELDRNPASGAIPVVIDETAQQSFFSRQDPVGKLLRDESHTYVVLGVARNVKVGFAAPNPVSTVFVPFTAQPSTSVDPGATIIVRGTAANTMSDVRNTIASLDPRLTVFNAGTVDERLGQFTAILHLSWSIYGGIGVFGLILACIGLAGVTAYAVARRRKEIGIRMALGARSAQVLRLVLREGVVMVAIGSVFGFFGAFLVYRVLAHGLFSAANLADSTKDPLLLLGAPLLLASLALLACYLPARRAARIDPLASLREE